MSRKEFDEIEAKRICKWACAGFADVIKMMPGRVGSIERVEGGLNATIGMLVGAAMARHNMGAPSEHPDIAGSLNRRILDALEDWEAQYAGR